MQVPAILYGDARDVRTRCKAALRNWLQKGVPYVEAMEAAGMFDVADIPSPIILEYDRHEHGFGLYLAVPAFLLTGEKGLLLPKARDIWPPRFWRTPRISEFFDASLTRPWAIMGIVDTQNTHLLFGTVPEPDLERYRRLIASVLRDCDELEAVGPRYTLGHLDPGPLSRHVNKVYIGLRELGVDMTRLRDILGLSALGPPTRSVPLRSVLQQLGVRIDPAWAADRLPDHPHVLVPPPLPPPPPPCDLSEHTMSPAMEHAIETHDQDAVRRLIAAGESPARFHLATLQAPLFWAIQHGYTDLVAFLLDHGASIEDRADEGESPLMKAAFYGHTGIVRLLLERGAKVRDRTEKGWDARSYAEMGGNPEVRRLIAEAWKRPRRR